MVLNNVNENNQVADSAGDVKAGKAPGARKPFFRSLRKPKHCVFCVDSSKKMDLKDPSRLYRFISDRSKILSRRVTGLCACHQREMAKYVKVARFLSLVR